MHYCARSSIRKHPKFVFLFRNKVQNPFATWSSTNITVVTLLALYEENPPVECYYKWPVMSCHHSVFQVWREFDRDHSGYIEADELKVGLIRTYLSNHCEYLHYNALGCAKEILLGSPDICIWSVDEYAITCITEPVCVRYLTYFKILKFAPNFCSRRIFWYCSNGPLDRCVNCITAHALRTCRDACRDR